MSTDKFHAYLDGDGYIVAWRDEGAALVATRTFPELREDHPLSWEEANEIAAAMNFAFRLGVGVGEKASDHARWAAPVPKDER